MRYFEDTGDCYEESGEECLGPTQPQSVVGGIDLKELAAGKEVVFHINDYSEIDVNYNSDQSDGDDDVASCCTLNDLRMMRGAPEPDLDFKSIAAKMSDLDSEGYVKKEVISQGNGSIVPDQSRVVIHYNFYKEFDDEPFDSTYLRGRPCKLRLGQGELIPGLEMAIKSMKKKENSRFLIKWQVAFGQQGCPPRIGKECDILADVTLLDYSNISVYHDKNALTEEEIHAFNFEEVIKEAKNYHFMGNEEFKSGFMKGAIRRYKKCLKILRETRLKNDKEEEKMRSLEVKCHVNMAISYNKLGLSELACLSCQEALSIDPRNVKAAFQYGKANMHLCNLEKAEKWLLKAKNMKPSDEDINKELDKLHVKKKMSHIQDERFCQRAMGSISVTSTE